jgi:hypothetical protein
MSVPRKNETVGRILFQAPEPGLPGEQPSRREKPPSLYKTFLERVRLGFCEAKITVISARAADQQITWREGRGVGRWGFVRVSQLGWKMGKNKGSGVEVLPPAKNLV